MTTLADSSLLQSLKEDDPSLSLEELLVPALHPTSWDASFVLRALSFLDECTASPSFVQKKFPAAFVKYGFPELILPPFETMVAMAKVLDYLGFPVPSLQPLIREIREHSAFDSSYIREYSLFSPKPLSYSPGYEHSLLFHLASRGLLSLVQRVYSGETKTSAVCTAAAAYGHLNVLRWLRTQNPPCPWDIETCTVTAAAHGHGHLDVLKWLRTQNPPCPWGIETCTVTAANGHLDVLKWMRSQDPPCPWNNEPCYYAALNGHLDVLKWLRAQDPPCPWDERVCTVAAETGRLEVLQWLRAQDPPCPWEKETCAYAARNGYLDVLKWLRAQVPPCPWNTWTCTYAAWRGHLNVLKWARAQNPPCPWDEWTCHYATTYTSFDVLKWLRSQDPPCPWDKDRCLRLSNIREIQLWIQEERGPLTMGVRT
jgi:hypothetical protein